MQDRRNAQRTDNGAGRKAGTLEKDEGITMVEQICNECGRSVAPGSGWFVNRVPDLNDMETRRENGKPFPEGDFLCVECDEKGSEEVRG